MAMSLTPVPDICASKALMAWADASHRRFAGLLHSNLLGKLIRYASTKSIHSELGSITPMRLELDFPPQSTLMKQETMSGRMTRFQTAL
jgi:hypothetical protein